MESAERLQLAVAAVGLAVAGAWLFAARRGRDPLGPRPEAPFGDTTVPLLVAGAAYVPAFLALGPLLGRLGVAGPGRFLAASIVHLLFALALVRAASRAAPPSALGGGRQALAGLLAGVATYGLVACVGFSLQAAYDAAGVPFPEQDVVAQFRALRGLDLAGALAASAVLAPFAEEVFWRGVLLPALLRALTPSGANLAQAFLFGLVHVVSAGPAMWPLALPLAVVGWLAGALYLRTGSLAAAVLLHAVFNATNLALLFASL